MVAQGKVKPPGSGVLSPTPPGQGQQAMRAAGMATPSLGPQARHPTPKMPPAGEVKAEVLHQRSKLPFPPGRMAIGGVAVVLTLAYFTLYSKKKPEATALDVAKVTVGTGTPAKTHPRN